MTYGVTGWIHIGASIVFSLLGGALMKALVRSLPLRNPKPS
jgi:hypothetical protein